ncbi:F0F1 ATP synthase subunit C [Spiroplasma tabanidicola]|uniref:ATP synthase subunit c n=1 Tax=Spiroplasma tabanidicola TaxID=324079 RepID=A0A6I6C9C5_9MOLU|nr:F0F1 ATP synthase subunit C [Spiroplasma tabanidicola]QGS51501.1 F0F1 ATP synthase subunit C [Spiroplasma tabanidicola]
MFTEMLFSFVTNFGQAWVSTIPAILFVSTGGNGDYAIGAGITGIGMIGASLGQGIVGQGACLAIGRNPEVAGKITTTLIITAGFSESGAIYALVIAILILFVLA